MPTAAWFLRRPRRLEQSWRKYRTRSSSPERQGSGAATQCGSRRTAPAWFQQKRFQHMRHRFGNAKLKRDVGSRNSLFKNLTTSVIEEERVITTVPKAKAVQPLVEKMITLAKR